MAEITKIKCNDVEYDIKDETARSSVTSLQSSVGTLTTRVNALETGGAGGTGPKGDKGDDGVTFTPSVSEAGVISWTNNGGLNNPESVNIKGAKGDNGTNGTDGVSPTVTVSKSGKVTTVTITDKDGEHVATINDGADGTGSGGSGDMTKAIYDTDEDGIVDNASKLGGQLPAYYAKASDLAGKVDTETGKGLSSNDYTDAEKTKLSGVETGAQKNVQSDWNATSGDALILNKPTIPTVPTKVSDLENDSGFITGYTEADPTVPAWAKAESKPTYTASEVGAAAASHTHAQSEVTGLETALAGKVDVVSGKQLSTNDYTTTEKNKLAGLTAPMGKTVSLTAAGWSNKAQTVSVSDMTASSIFFVTYTPASRAAWVEADIYCSAQGAGTLTFTCSTVPTEAITANVVILG